MKGDSLHNCEIHLKDITKIEGHATLDVTVRNKEVKSVKFAVTENRRFFENLITGQNYKDIPGIVGRICGFCSIAHMLASVHTIEDAFNVEPSTQTLLLRELLAHAGTLKSHALHLYFLALPDYLGKESALDFNKKEHEYIHQALRLKRTGTDMLKAIGRRGLHSLPLRPGGFSALPPEQELSDLRKILLNARKDAEETVELFANLNSKFEFSHDTNYIALTGKGYCIACGNVTASNGVTFTNKEYSKYLKETDVPHSTAKQAKFFGKDFMVGSLARMNINHKELSKPVKSKMHALGIKFPQHNPFSNNLAQALEIMQSLESAIEIIDNLKIRKEALPKIKPSSATGYGLTEAPRGTLYHEYTFNSSGAATSSNIIVPTSQNQIRIEKDVAEYLPSLLQLPQKQIELELEKLIRAYHPCISCATHFLKVNWN